MAIPAGREPETADGDNFREILLDHFAWFDRLMSSGEGLAGQQPVSP
jgi:hypothetical protein